jgi:hypothetical protein
MITQYGVYFIIYLSICFFYAFYIVSKEKSKNFAVEFMIVFWLMTFQVYKTEYVWREFPQIGFFRKFDQALSWFLFLIIILKIISNEVKNRKVKLLRFEKYLYGYLFLSIFLYELHDMLGNLSAYKSLAYIRLYLSTAIFYFVVKNFTSKELIRALFKTIIFLGVLTSLVSIYQFFIDSKFLRLGAFYMAFPGYNRSSGLFTWPYDNGMFILLAIFVTSYTLKNFRIKIALNSLYIIAMILVFTRGVWLALIAISFVHAYIYYRITLHKILIAIPIIVLLTIGIVGAYAMQKDYFSGDAWTERVFVDTVSVRIAFYSFVIQAIPKKWVIGYGDIENNEVYFKGMVNAKQGLVWSLGRRGGIHNVILEEAFLKGIIVPIIYILMYYEFFKFCVQESKKRKTYFYAIMNNYTTGFFFYVFSVGAYLLSRSGYLTVFFFAIAAGVYHNKVDLSDMELKYDEEPVKSFPVIKKDVELEAQNL